MASGRLMFINVSGESGERDCLICSKNIRARDFPRIIQKALDRKYCSNLNSYYFVKSVNRIIANERCIENVLYKEWCNYLEENYLKRLYRAREFPSKFKRLICHYEKSLFRPLNYAPRVMRVQLRYYFVRERLARGEDIYLFSRAESTSNRSNTSLCSNTDGILDRLRFSTLRELAEPQPLAFAKKPEAARHDAAPPTPRADAVTASCPSPVFALLDSPLRGDRRPLLTQQSDRSLFALCGELAARPDPEPEPAALSAVFRDSPLGRRLDKRSLQRVFKGRTNPTFESGRKRRASQRSGAKAHRTEFAEEPPRKTDARPLGKPAAEPPRPRPGLEAGGFRKYLDQARSRKQLQKSQPDDAAAEAKKAAEPPRRPPRKSMSQNVVECFRKSFKTFQTRKGDRAAPPESTSRNASNRELAADPAAGRVRAKQFHSQDYNKYNRHAEPARPQRRFKVNSAQFRPAQQLLTQGNHLETSLKDTFRETSQRNFSRDLRPNLSARDDPRASNDDFYLGAAARRARALSHARGLDAHCASLEKTRVSSLRRKNRAALDLNPIFVNIFAPQLPAAKIYLGPGQENLQGQIITKLKNKLDCRRAAERDSCKPADARHMRLKPALMEKLSKHLNRSKDARPRPEKPAVKNSPRRSLNKAGHCRSQSNTDRQALTAANSRAANPGVCETFRLAKTPGLRQKREGSRQLQHSSRGTEAFDSKFSTRDPRPERFQLKCSVIDSSHTFLKNKNLETFFKKII